MFTALATPACAQGSTRPETATLRGQTSSDSLAPMFQPTNADTILGDSLGSRVRTIPDTARTATPVSDAMRRAGGRRILPGAGRDSLVRPKRGTFDQPRWVMLRSLVVPGWGQLHNRAWLKAAGVAGLETWLLLNVVRDNRDLNDLDAAVKAAVAAGDHDAERVAVDRYNARLDRYVGRQWMLGAAVVFSLVDAYVDAHFVDFRFEFGRDTALPTGARIAWERRF